MHPLIEGEDYYLENGFFVFTESFHRKRGHCCESGCRHCPYGFGAAAAPDPATPPAATGGAAA